MLLDAHAYTWEYTAAIFCHFAMPELHDIYGPSSASAPPRVLNNPKLY